MATQLTIDDQLGVKSYGFCADKGSYRGYKYASFREYLARCKAIIDVLRHRTPKYLGETIDVNGNSNYTKDQSK